MVRKREDGERMAKGTRAEKGRVRTVQGRKSGGAWLTESRTLPSALSSLSRASLRAMRSVREAVSEGAAEALLPMLGLCRFWIGMPILLADAECRTCLGGCSRMSVV